MRIHPRDLSYTFSTVNRLPSTNVTHAKACLTWSLPVAYLFRYEEWPKKGSAPCRFTNKKKKEEPVRRLKPARRRPRRPHEEALTLQECPLKRTRNRLWKPMNKASIRTDGSIRRNKQRRTSDSIEDCTEETTQTTHGWRMDRLHANVHADET